MYAMVANIHNSLPPLQWNLTQPENRSEGALIIVLPDWVYGLLPYCGPGLRKDAWIREYAFQNEVCRFFHDHGIATLHLTPGNPELVPTDEEILTATQIPDVYSVIKKIAQENSYNLNKSAIFGHGFGTRMMSEIVSFGLRPAGFIIANGIYSDIDSIISQKYLPYKQINLGLSDFRKKISLDPDTSLIIQNLGRIHRAIRKKTKRVRIREPDRFVDLLFPSPLFSEETSPAVLLSVLDAPSLIIHGSGDLDIPVSNAFFLETKLKQKVSSVSRIIMLDCDHWFRGMAQEMDDRIYQRLSGTCIENPIDQGFLQNCQVFVEDLLKIKRVKSISPQIAQNPGMVNQQAQSFSG